MHGLRTAFCRRLHASIIPAFMFLMRHVNVLFSSFYELKTLPLNGLLRVAVTLPDREAFQVR